MATGLTAGVTYAVDFIMASERDNSDSLRVSVDGQAGTVFTAPGNGLWNNWVGQKYLFTATGTTAKVQFDTIGLNQLGYDVGLDNVRLSVTDSPEPGTLVLLALGISGLSLLRPGRAVRN